MIDATGVILTEDGSDHLKELTELRTVAALPVAGRYRLIDFVLSNMVNSGIISVGVAPQMNYQSLMDHIGTGKPWDLNRKTNGLFILPPYVGKDSYGIAKGDIDALHNVFGFLRKSKQKYVLISGCNIVCNIDYREAFQFHIEKRADITLIYAPCDRFAPDALSRGAVMELDDKERVVDVEAYSKQPTLKGNKGFYLGMAIIEKNLLISLVEDCIAHGESHFIFDVLVKRQHRLNMYGYQFDGYIKKIEDTKSYLQFNMDMLNVEIRREIFQDSRKIYTKVKDRVPTKYGCCANVKNSLIADGCLIEGAVENSVLFRGVHVKPGTTVRNSIIMQDCEIYESCELENVILDKEVLVRGSNKLIGQSSYPILIGKREVV